MEKSVQKSFNEKYSELEVIGYSSMRVTGEAETIATTKLIRIVVKNTTEDLCNQGHKLYSKVRYQKVGCYKKEEVNWCRHKISCLE